MGFLPASSWPRRPLWHERIGFDLRGHRGGYRHLEEGARALRGQHWRDAEHDRHHVVLECLSPHDTLARLHLLSPFGGASAVEQTCAMKEKMRMGMHRSK